MTGRAAVQLTFPSGLAAVPESPVHQESPLVRLLGRGAAALTDGELLAVLLDEAKPIRADRLLDRAGGIAGLPALEARLASEPQAPEVGRVRAALELARRLARCELSERRLLDKKEKVASYLHLRFARAGQEVLGALFVDSRCRLLADLELCRGTICSVAVEPRMPLREALDRDAAGLFLFHTHPSGDPEPSREDLVFTRRLDKAAKYVGVSLHDHLIVGHGGRWVSLKDRGGW